MIRTCARVPAHAAALLAALATLAGPACSRPSDSSRNTEPSQSASATPSNGARSTPSATPSASPTATTVSWTGTYKSTPGSLYVHDGGEWTGVRFRGDDAAVGLGEGTLSFTVDRKTGRLQGAASGPIGDVVIHGTFTGDALAFSVLRKDPAIEVSRARESAR